MAGVFIRSKIRDEDMFVVWCGCDLNWCLAGGGELIEELQFGARGDSVCAGGTVCQSVGFGEGGACVDKAFCRVGHPCQSVVGCLMVFRKFPCRAVQTDEMDAIAPCNKEVFSGGGYEAVAEEQRQRNQEERYSGDHWE